MSNNNWIVAISAIVIGWMLNQLGQWFSTRAEDKRNLKIALYGLLEVYFNLLRYNFKPIIKIAADTLFRRLPVNERNEAMEKMVYDYLNEFMEFYIKDEMQKKMDISKNYFFNSIEILKSIDPLIAYSLNGKESNVEQIEQILNKIAKDFKEDEKSNSTIKEIFNIYNSSVLEITLDDLKKAIIHLSKKISPVMFLRTKTKIKALQFENKEVLKEYFNTIYEKIEDLETIK